MLGEDKPQDLDTLAHLGLAAGGRGSQDPPQGSWLGDGNGLGGKGNGRRWEEGLPHAHVLLLSPAGAGHKEG